ncbi:MAG: permease [Synechococcales bacterium]|nr:permease [Synechococcales bacterium]
MNQLSGALTLFFSLMVEAVPFLLIGVLFSSALLLFIDEQKLIALMPRQPLLGALVGSLLGFMFPVCECGNVPVARRLLMQGAPASVAIGFLLAAPTINPIVLWATWTAFRDQPEIVVLRFVLSLLVAITIAWVFSRQTDMRPFLQDFLAQMVPAPPRQKQQPSWWIGAPPPSPPSTSPLLQSGTFLLGSGRSPQRLDGPGIMALSSGQTLSQPLASRLVLMLNNVVQELRELGGMLVIGSAIAAIVQVAVPREIILSLGQGPVTSILAMMTLAAVVSICSTVDSFFALSFASTFTSGSLLAFLVFGPMIDVKNIGLLFSIFRSRAILYLFALAAQLTFLLTLILNLYVS